ncbi:alpha/beta-hydrolase [Suillus ampliporus]|nr:alpha/beta-hydrolase [Suillus ampliporus]
MLPTALTALLVQLLGFFLDRSQRPQSAHLQKPLRFELRHEHAVSPDAHVVFSDVPVNIVYGNQSLYSIDTRHTTLYRPSSLDAYNDARIRSMRHAQSANLPWYETDILEPNVESRETLLELAKMTNNAYVPRDDSQWYELGENWHTHYPFGWEPDADGLRGYVFATPDNSIVILSIKGTSAAAWGDAGPTAKKDKLNDNLLFSCCCAKIDWTWTAVCGCHRGGWKCDQNCLEQALVEDSLFYPIGMNLYNNLTYMYPTSDIWIIGHSLGGALASLLGITFGTPVVAFESPGEKMATRRLHLPSPPSTHHVTHVYHTADPIAMGTCNGVLSSCALGGFAMETRCHQGKSIVYDTVSNLSWSVDIRKHGIVSVIDEILGKPWQPSEDVGRSVPLAVVEEDCVECYSWEFGDYNP